MRARPHIASLNVSDGGVPKRPVSSADVTELGMAGDRQRNLKYHGGRERALCLYSMERLAQLRAEGHRIGPGSLGENVTLAELDWDMVSPGAQLWLGGVLVEITTYTVPCRTIAHLFHDRRLSRVGQKTHPGWSRVYARVLVAGRLAVGDPVSIAVAAPAPLRALP